MAQAAADTASDGNLQTASAEAAAGAVRGTAAVLGQYLAGARAVKPARAMVPRHTPERAVAMAIGRAAQRACALPLTPLQARVGSATLAELPELLPEHGLTVIVEGPKGALGVVALSPGLLAAVIEMQSLGRILPQPPRERRPTRTDASICADFINAALMDLAGELFGLPDSEGPAVFRFASHVDDPKPLELMLDDILYRCFRLDARLGHGGQREGGLIILLPEGPRLAPGADAAAPASVASTAPPGESQQTRSLAASVRTVPIWLDAVLCRRKMPLRELRALAPGSLLSLPHEAMENVRIETVSGQLLARGRLGVLHGARAVRIAPSEGAPAAAPDMATASPVARDNVFAPLAAGDGGPASHLEPPIDDVGGPNPFRLDPEAEMGSSDDDADQPLNFAVE